MAQRLNEAKIQIVASLHDTSKPWTSVLAKAERKTGLDRLYIFIGTNTIIVINIVILYCPVVSGINKE